MDWVHTYKDASSEMQEAQVGVHYGLLAYHQQWHLRCSLIPLPTGKRTISTEVIDITKLDEHEESTVLNNFRTVCKLRIKTIPNIPISHMKRVGGTYRLGIAVLHLTYQEKNL